jgi:hypothetical protein
LAVQHREARLAETLERELVEVREWGIEAPVLDADKSDIESRKHCVRTRERVQKRRSSETTR